MTIPADLAAPRRADAMIDGFGRRISYVRISVTDRCDLRCRYCMTERMRFMPRRDLLEFDEIVSLADILIARGVRRIRLTGGEPLVRRGIEGLVAALGTRIGRGLDELTLTTNGMRLEQFAGALRRAGVARVNVSLDSLEPAGFAHITRGGDLAQVLKGIAAATDEGLRIKINMVALAGLNADQIKPMMRWCAAQGHGLTLIETMPLGWVEEDRTSHYLPLDQVRRELAERYTLTPSISRTGGPARYFDVKELGLTLGFITPLTENFCEGCNRIRIAADGSVYGCLGQDQKVELREALRGGGGAAVEALFDCLLAGKPRRHDFRIDAAEPAVERHMSVTGG
jgi:cyclic pyranopterin phosphate synthase